MAGPIAAGPVPVDRPITAGLAVADHPPTEGRQAVADRQVVAEVGPVAVVVADRQMVAASITSRLLFIG